MLAEADGAATIEQVGIEAIRAGHDDSTAEYCGPGEPVGAVEDHAADGVPVRSYRPATDGSLPLVIYFHGGGWSLGSIVGSDPMCRALCNAAPAVVVSVGYRLAPEHPFPAALDDAETATRWAAANAAALGADPQRICLAGDSAGGDLATVVARRFRDDPGAPAVALQALVYPVTDGALDTATYVSEGDGYGLNTGRDGVVLERVRERARPARPRHLTAPRARPPGHAARLDHDCGARPAPRRGRGVRRAAA